MLHAVPIEISKRKLISCSSKPSFNFITTKRIFAPISTFGLVLLTSTACTSMLLKKLGEVLRLSIGVSFLIFQYCSLLAGGESMRFFTIEHLYLLAAEMIFSVSPMSRFLYYLTIPMRALLFADNVTSRFKYSAWVTQLLPIPFNRAPSHIAISQNLNLYLQTGNLFSHEFPLRQGLKEHGKE